MECRKEIAVGLAFKDFAFWTGYSSVGLNVAAVKTAEELRRHHIPTYLMGVKNNVDLLNSILWVNGKRQKQGKCPLTHVVIMAPWMTPLDLQAMLKHFPDTQFTIKSHCNVAALYGDFRGIGNFRNYADMTFEFPNLSLSGNSRSFSEWFSEAYGVNTFLLPDLYPFEHHEKKTHEHHGIRLGCFGVLRPEKNVPSAVAAAILVQNYLNAPVTFHYNTGGEVDAKNIQRTIDEMSQGIPGFEVIKHKWMPWDKFTQLVGTMDLLFQPSFTESFNIVTADGIAVDVPSVVSHAVKWAPDAWKADADNPTNIAKVALSLLDSPMAWMQGRQALNDHNVKGLRLWKNYLYDEDPEGDCPASPIEPADNHSNWIQRFLHFLFY